MTQQAWLRAFMKQHKISRMGLAALAECSIHTVNSWLLPDGSKSARKMPPMAKGLLECKTKETK